MDPNVPKYSCTRKFKVCPLGGNCLVKSVIYNADITLTGREKMSKKKEKDLKKLEEK